MINEVSYSERLDWPGGPAADAGFRPPGLREPQRELSDVRHPSHSARWIALARRRLSFRPTWLSRAAPVRRDTILRRA